MASVLASLPRASYASGATPFGPVACPGNVAGFRVTLSRCTTADPTTWPNASTVVTISLDCSYDGGANYQINQFGGKKGGGIVSAHGEEIDKQIWIFSFTPTLPTHLKGSVSIAGGPLVTDILIEAL